MGATAFPQKKPQGWKRTPLFENWMLVDGVRRRVTHLELREGYRLWAKHKDIRLGRFE